MPRIRSSRKRAEWSARLNRFDKSNQTVAQFCLSESISQQAFYQWRRRFRDESDTVPSVPQSASNRFEPVAIELPNGFESNRLVVIRGAKGVTIELRDAVSIGHVLTRLQDQLVVGE